MAVLFLDGFDKYGGVNNNSAGVAALLTAGEWTGFNNATFNIVAGLSSTGQALVITPNNASPLIKTLSASYSRLIGGFRFSSNLGNVNAGISFGDAGSQQCSLTINGAGVGTISLRNGAVGGTALATSSTAVSANSTHYLEWDITFGNSGAYQAWLDGVSLFSSTGDTTTTANNTANQIILSGSVGSLHIITYDDFYLFDSTGTTNNAVLLTSPRIETTFPTSDNAVQFAPGVGILGSSVARSATINQFVANSLNLRRFIPSSNCTLSSISIIPSSTSGVINHRPVVYGDTAGTAGTLLSTGSTVVGMTGSVTLTMPLTTPQVLTAGTPYWLGLMNDIATLNYQLSDNNALGYRANATFASGAPGTAPALGSGQSSWLMWGNLTGVAVNFDEVNNQPPDGQYSYVYDSTVNHEDLYNFNALSQVPAFVYAAAVKGYMQKSDSGTRTVSLRAKSGATDGGGSLTGQSLGTSFGWFSSYFTTDPNTGTAWTGTTLNAATSGFRIDS